MEKPIQALPRKEPTQSPSKKELYNASLDNFLDFPGKGLLSPQANQFRSIHGNVNCHHEFHISQMQFSKLDIENSPGRKRRSEEIVLNNVENERFRIQRSSKVHKGGGYDSRPLLELSDGSNKNTERMGVYTPLKDWADVGQQFTMLLFCFIIFHTHEID